MIPFADFFYFGVLLYAVVPTLALGWFGRAGRCWALFVTLTFLPLHFYKALAIRPDVVVRELWIVVAFALFAWAVARVFLRMRAGSKSPWLFRATLLLALTPLAAAKFLPLLAPQTQFGFLGISYVTFRVLDVIFSVNDKLITTLPATEFFGYVFFFPTISSGPIDRYRRFAGDWRKTRTREEFLTDLDGAVHRIMRGFLYKFLIAALIEKHWVESAAKIYDFAHIVSYTYGYSLYLFFDFAGYSAFAIAFSYLFGIHTPENFDRPFLAKNIRDFWNRWHITLSFWFRDHVYMRFLLAAAKGKWFKNRNVAGAVGFFVSFGLMGVWHITGPGTAMRYIGYGIYHAVLLTVYDVFSRWNKTRKLRGDGPGWRVANVLLTVHAVCFGFLIFSGHLGTDGRAVASGMLERVDAVEISGWAWNNARPNEPVKVDIVADHKFLATVVANDLRDDLRQNGIGRGEHGFHFALPASLKDGKPHQIKTRISGVKSDLPGSPKEFTAAAPEH